MLLLSSGAEPADPAWGANDIPTVFYFSKSDDKNRVDYGLRLDANCRPTGEEPLVPYWREFESEPPGLRTHSLKFFEYAGYGVAEQKTTKKLENGAELTIRLKALDRQIVITSEKGEGGKCKATARALIGTAQNAELVSAFIKLKRAWSVDYVEVRGKDHASGSNISERITP